MYISTDLAIRLPRNDYPDAREMGFPLLSKVIGRDTDIVYTPNGKHLIVHFFTGIFEFFPQIRQFRIIQTELSSVKIEFIADVGFEVSLLERVEAEIRKYVEPTFKIEFAEVTHIPSTKSGKPQIIESNLAQLPFHP